MSLRPLDSVAVRNLARRQGPLPAHRQRHRPRRRRAVRRADHERRHQRARSTVPSRADAARPTSSSRPVGNFDSALRAGTSSTASSALPDVDGRRRRRRLPQRARASPGERVDVDEMPRHRLRRTASTSPPTAKCATTMLRVGQPVHRRRRRGRSSAATSPRRLDVGVGDEVLVAAPTGSGPGQGRRHPANSGRRQRQQRRHRATRRSPSRSACIGKGPTSSTASTSSCATASTPRSGSTTQQAALGENVSFTNAATPTPASAAFITAVNGALTLGSAIALFVGGFLIFLTFSLAVAERTRTYGTMRALGALPKQVRQRRGHARRRCSGSVSAIGGLVLGYGLACARPAAGAEPARPRACPGLGLPLGPAIFSVAVGVIISVVAAWLPGRRAAALSPVAAMREGGVRDEKAGRPVIGARARRRRHRAGLRDLPTTAARIVPTLLVLFGCRDARADRARPAGPAARRADPPAGARRRRDRGHAPREGAQPLGLHAGAGDGRAGDDLRDRHQQRVDVAHRSTRSSSARPAGRSRSARRARSTRRSKRELKAFDGVQATTPLALRPRSTSPTKARRPTSSSR